jgi:hypothetical protein
MLLSILLQFCFNFAFKFNVRRYSKGKTAMAAIGVPGPAAAAAAGHHGLTGHPGGAAAIRAGAYTGPLLSLT